MKLYLIRHGQTDWNREGKIQGRTDIPLNQTGLEQADCLAEALKGRPVTAVYSSPLSRAWQTAEAVARSQLLPVTPCAGLREVDFGLWEGLTWKEIDKSYHEDFVSWDQSPAEHAPTGGESGNECRARARTALDRILAETEGDAAIVAHGAILVFAAEYLLRSRKKRNEIIVKNASITTVEYDRGKGLGTLIELNEVRHLVSGKE